MAVHFLFRILFSNILRKEVIFRDQVTDSEKETVTGWVRIDRVLCFPQCTQRVLLTTKYCKSPESCHLVRTSDRNFQAEVAKWVRLCQSHGITCCKRSGHSYS